MNKFIARAVLILLICATYLLAMISAFSEGLQAIHFGIGAVITAIPLLFAMLWNSEL